MIMRIVSPITPQFVNPDMRDTLKISEVIRLQQNELIAAGKYDKKPPSPASSNWSDGPSIKTATNSAIDGDSEHRPNAASQSPTRTENGSQNGSGNDPAPQGDEVNGTNSPGNTLKENPDVGQIVEIDCDSDSIVSEGQNSSPVDDVEFSRMSGAFTRKTLKRNNAPGPLRMSPKSQAATMGPTINSAPMRSIYGPPYAMRRAPVRYIYPTMAHMPQTAVHYVPTPIRRNVALPPDRISKPRSPRALSARRRKPVLDVFEGQVAKLAPMPSQPPSAQKEEFEISHSDDEKATQEEMEEMELKRKRAMSALKGSISFNDESAFNFTIFQGNEHNAKKKFLEICETTWDKYMGEPIGS
ncbi:hypothetical protein JCM33374_g6005 [Metschnikowia sp. JCM 33374]|nr:hypothetical protein JCM33374_g6005 [Metschnikowia sp. JCM 33374]